MGTYRKVAALGLALGAMACGTKKEQVATLDAGLQKDLAAVKAPDPGLALAGQGGGYQRMNYVSAVEQVKPGVPSKHVARTSTPSRTSKRPRKSNPAPAPVAEDVATADAPMPEPEQTPSAAPAPAPEPVVVVQQPSPEPTPAPVGNSGEGSAGGRGNRGGGWGSILGGIIGSVVIRGGMGGVDHCDPRTDGRNRPVYPTIPISRMPVNTGGPVFGGHGRH